MELSIEEAVQQVKAEIIAPDWRLNARRIESLQEAFTCLEERLGERKGLKAILTMAGNVLQYIKAHGDHSPPDSIDFLKEAMADVVNLYEEGDVDPERDERVFRKVFAHFQELKAKIKTHRIRRPAAPAVPPPFPEGGRVRAADSDAPETGDEEPIFREPAPREGSAERPSPPPEAERLLAELQHTLERAEEVGATLQELLQAAAALRGETPAAPPPAAGPAGPQPAASSAAATPSPRGGGEFAPCPPTPLREITLNGLSFGLPEDSVALIRPLDMGARERYLREGQVPLRDFRRWFTRLGKQFAGTLAALPDRKLRQLVLPVVSLQAFGMDELPDPQASTLLVLSYGQWHGVLFCAGVREELRIMTGFRKAANGDIAGLGALEGGGELSVVNGADLLRREGYLALV